MYIISFADLPSHISELFSVLWRMAFRCSFKDFVLLKIYKLFFVAVCIYFIFILARYNFILRSTELRVILLRILKLFFYLLASSFAVDESYASAVIILMYYCSLFSGHFEVFSLCLKGFTDVDLFILILFGSSWSFWNWRLAFFITSKTLQPPYLWTSSLLQSS